MSGFLDGCMLWGLHILLLFVLSSSIADVTSSELTYVGDLPFRWSSGVRMCSLHCHLAYFVTPCGSIENQTQHHFMKALCVKIFLRLVLFSLWSCLVISVFFSRCYCATFSLIWLDGVAVSTVVLCGPCWFALYLTVLHRLLCELFLFVEFGLLMQSLVKFFFVQTLLFFITPAFPFYVAAWNS